MINRATQKNPPLIVDYLGPGAVDAAVNNDREQMRSDITTSPGCVGPRANSRP